MAKAHKVHGIDCHASANIGIRLVLLERFDEVLEFRDNALNWEDPEGVHSMRVASRRLRSALRDFSPYIKKRGMASTLTQIKSVADALGDVRDQDVAIQKLEALKVKTAPAVAKTIENVLEERKAVRGKAREKLKETISRHEMQQLRSDFREAVSVATYIASAKPALSYRDVAREIIAARLSDFERLSDDLFKPFDVEGLHELRITGKRLRYAIELFDQCLKVSTLSIAKRIARLQSELGDVHDCDVWIENFGKAIIDADKDRQSESQAFAWLLNHFLKVRTGHLHSAFTLWNNWQQKHISDKLLKAVEN